MPVDSRTGPPGAGVADSLDMLLGEHLLPLRTRRSADEPHLLAIDAAGQPVVVEVVGLLDAEVCLRAMAYAGAASRMTWQDVAASYQGGAGVFQAHFDAFRSTVLASSQLSTQVRSGARLMLVCTDVSSDIDDVLEFLLQPGWQVEVLCVRVTTDATGARVADVVPVERSAPHREVPGPPRTQPVPVHVPRQEPHYRRTEPPVDHRAAAPDPVVPTVVPPAFAVVRGGAADGPGAGAPTGAPADTGAGWGVDPDVADLASRMGGTTDLVWDVGSGRRYDVLLHADGRIELPDGSVVDDVATAAERLHGPVPDAWAVWRVGDRHGPSLADLLR